MAESLVASDRPAKRDGQGAAASVAMSGDEAARLLTSNPAAAEVWARNFLAQHPGNQGALLLLAVGLRLQKKLAAAKEVLEQLTRAQPDAIRAQFELGLTLGELGRHDEAIPVLTRAVDLMPNFPDAWYALADQLERRRPSQQIAGTREARQAIRDGRLDIAEALLAERLRFEPDSEPARFLLSIVLLAQEKGRDALPPIETLIAGDPGNSLFRDLKAAALFQIEDFGGAIAEYEAILKKAPDRPGAWMAYGRALRAIGRQAECTAAFRKAIELLPTWVEARRSLASVKTYRCEPAEVDALRAQLARSDLAPGSYAELHFALGKALEDTGGFAESFENYDSSQKLQRANIAYDADASTRWLRREVAVFSPSFLRERSGVGCQSAAPIFVVGMPRAGSTLVQEILCAHSAIERTGELRHLTRMTAEIDRESAAQSTPQRYPEALRFFGAGRFKSLGEEYLQRTRLHRKLGRPHFVDKYPGNFYRTGLIHLILPNAKIIDVRRHPLDCCLSCFKHYFPEAPPFSHNLTDLGRYYADYVEFMAHFDDVLPGKIHRLIYEELVENPEREVRRLFDYLGLPFEDACLRFYEREQAIMTSSTEQARLPIYKTGIGAWRNYEPWIGPLKAALGRVLECYPAAPDFRPQFQFSMSMRLA